MARRVYAFPPITVRGCEWTIAQPMNVSRGMFGGAAITSVASRARRVAAMQTSSFANDGAGYVEVLKELLQGGVNLVRLNSLPVNHRSSVKHDPTRQSWPYTYRTGSDPLAWRTVAGQPLVHFTGVRGGATSFATPIGVKLSDSSAGFGRLAVSGLPPDRQVLRAGEFVAVYPGQTPADFANGVRRRALRPATTNEDGECTIITVTPFPNGGPCNLGVPDTGVFMVDAIPRAMRTPGADWPYDWSFTEVFEDETPGGFQEIDPW